MAREMPRLAHVERVVWRALRFRVGDGADD